LGLSRVWGYKRVPKPAANKTAFIFDALNDKDKETSRTKFPYPR
jgi:hypothetical protein